MTGTARRSAGAWQVGPARMLSLDQPRLMGVLNVTPDSFSDGGQFLDPEAAVKHALEMVEQGAAIIDVGGESTRPGAARVPADEQIRRVVPIIERIRARDADILISVDTTLGEVARAAIEAGANILNDVAAGNEDASLLDLAAAHGLGLVLMHRVRPPDADVFSHQYRQAPIAEDVVEAVRRFLLERAQVARDRGVAAAQIVLDPGLGFGKSVAQNFELIARMRELIALGYPILGAASRKSFLGRAAGIERASDRDVASVGAAVCMFERGVRLFRVHDVPRHGEALSVAAAVEGAGKPMKSGTG